MHFVCTKCLFNGNFKNVSLDAAKSLPAHSNWCKPRWHKRRTPQQLVQAAWAAKARGVYLHHPHSHGRHLDSFLRADLGGVDRFDRPFVHFDLCMARAQGHGQTSQAPRGPRSVAIASTRAARAPSATASSSSGGNWLGVRTPPRRRNARSWQQTRSREYTAWRAEACWGG